MITINSPSDYQAIQHMLEPAIVRAKHGTINVPCMTPLLVRIELVAENLYNPNSVAPDKMDLLRESIINNGFCFPVVTIWDDEQQKFIVVDGAHRRAIMGNGWLDCEYIPIVVLPHTMHKRLAATWQFNKARGVHQVDLDAELIRALIEQGVDEEEIAKELGVELDTIHRYKQMTGIAELFKNADYSMAWEMEETA